MSVEKYKVASWSGVLPISSLANNALAVGYGYNNVQAGGGGDGYTLTEVEFQGTFASAPSDNTALTIWFLAQLSDGSTYEVGDSSLTPSRLPDVTIPLKNSNGASQPTTRFCTLPPGTVKPLVRNDGTGQTLTSGIIRIRPYTFEGTA